MRPILILLVLLCSVLSDCAEEHDNVAASCGPSQLPCLLESWALLLRREETMKEQMEMMKTQLNLVMSKLKASEDLLEGVKQENRDQRSKLEALSSRITSNQKKLGEQQSELQKLETLHADGAKVAFSASLRSFGSVGPLKEETTLKYTTVFINKGNGYDKTSGIFTAPVSGVYLFLFYDHALGGESAYLTLTRNGQRVVTTGHQKNVNEGSSNGGNAVTIQLSEGDQVCIRLWAGSWVFDDDKNYTTFTGILLFMV